ncbi:M20 family metallo-hydrolase [Desulfovibrio inopinatus]|uniref:M20 family metallo-hydrolase n=1 Tax=Desulfovibrio inopinatus TaxID=102109 RepID=UPI0004862F2B|nr:M20 family metallo-hydrolase [Desulfovibrio inopinatus]
MLDALFDHIDASRDTVIDLQRSLVSIPALHADAGGQGEENKAEFMRNYLRDMGIEPVTYKCPDTSVECGFRPNVAGVIPGKDTSRTFWVITHLDVVPPGDLTLWDTDPYELQVADDGDTIIGRGVEDNHQGLVSSILVAKALNDKNITPPINYGLLFVADEETGSHYGLGYMLRENEHLFSKNDLFLIPDFGDSTSEHVEVAEKSMLWVKFVVKGKQCHASRPQDGVNSLVASAAYIMKLLKLHEIFDKKNVLFKPANSTFEATKKEANVENVNTIPGRDVFYIDCRILPEYDLDNVLSKIKEMGHEIEKAFGVTITSEVTQREVAAPPTPVTSEIVTRMIDSIKNVYACDPEPVGIGGGTVAAVLRRKGYDAVVWSTLIQNAHQPNERSSIRYTIGDAKVMAGVLFKED